MELSVPTTLLNVDDSGVQCLDFKLGQVSFATFKSPNRETSNEDSLAILPISDSTLVLAVADGVGGHKGGAKASRLAIESLVKSISDPAVTPTFSLKDAIVSGLELGHQKICEMGVGAGSTILVAEIVGRMLRFYSVGDSVGLQLGGRGSLKYKTLEHSALGFAVEAGLVSEDKADSSDVSNHLILNCLGGDSLRIELSQELELASQDVVVLSSDGLTDNVSQETFMQTLAKGTLEEKAKNLVDAAQENMTKGQLRPAKPDDLSLILFNSSF